MANQDWKITNVLPSLSDVVTALANGRLLRVVSFGEARGLLQKLRQKAPSFVGQFLVGQLSNILYRNRYLLVNCPVWSNVKKA